MMRRLTLACAGMTLCAAGVTQLFAAAPDTVAANKATGYIRTLQNTDGGFPDFAATSSPGATIDAVFAFAATGVDPKTVTHSGSGASPDDYLSAQAATYSATAGGAAKLVLAVATLDLDASSFGGIDTLAVMETNYDPATGQYGGDVFAQTLFMLAEASLNRPVPAAAIAYLRTQQQPGGGWEYSTGWGTDTNTTSLAMRALIAGGVSAADPDISEAIVFLHNSQQPDGGFPYDPLSPFGTDSDPNSTAFVIQAIVAAGQSLDADEPWGAGGGKTPLTALLAFQNPVSGALQYFGTDSAFATYQGVPGLMLSAYPEQQVYEPPSTATATATAPSTPAPTACIPPLITYICSGTSGGGSAPPATTVASTPAPQSTVAAATVVPAAPTRGGRPLGAIVAPETGDGSATAGGSSATLTLLVLAASGVALAGAGALRLQARRRV